MTDAGLVRRLGFTDAVVLGLGSMLGAGVFASFSPAAGSGLLVALGAAGVVGRGVLRAVQSRGGRSPSS